MNPMIYIILTSLSAIIFVVIISYLLGIPFYTWSGERRELIHRKGENGAGEPWRAESLDLMEKSSENIVKMFAGEFGLGCQTTAKKVLEKGFYLFLISGPIKDQEAKRTLYNLLESYPKTFRYKQLPKRPEKEHFTILGLDRLFLEKKHPVDWKECKFASGYDNADPTMMLEYNMRFQKHWKKAEAISS